MDHISKVFFWGVGVYCISSRAHFLEDQLQRA